MFFGYVLVCAAVSMSISPATCTHVTGTMLHVTEESCYSDVQTAMISFSEIVLSDEYFIAEFGCVETQLGVQEGV